MLFPEGVAIDGNSGSVEPSTDRYMKRLSDLRGFFRDDAALERAIAAGDPVAYEVIDYRKPESDLAFGTTIMAPGKVGEEYFMTRGHFHERRGKWIGNVRNTAMGRFCFNRRRNQAD